MIAKHLLPRLARHYGKDSVVIFAPVHNRDGMLKEWEGMKLISGFRGDYHDDMMLEVYRREGATMLLMVGDWFHLRALPDHARDNPDFLWVQWAAMDYLRVPPEVTQLLKFAMYVVPFGDDAEQRARAAGLPNVLPGIPLGVEPAIWRPLKPEDYRLASQSCGFEEGAVNFLIVSANQQRKYVREQLEGIALWRKGTPGAKVRLYLHGHIEGDRNFQDDVRDAGLDDVTAMPNPYDLMQGGFSEETMNRIFNSASIVLNACFPAGQVVLTADGVKKIEAIKPRDLVLTHEGRASPVTKVFQRTVTDGLVIIKPKGLPTQSATGGHPFLAVRPSDGVSATAGEAAEFALDIYRQGHGAQTAASLVGATAETIWHWRTNNHQPRWGHYRLPPPPKWFKAGELQIGDFLALPRRIEVKDVDRMQLSDGRTVPINEETMWLIGLYLAEGTASVQKSQVRFSLGEQDVQRGITDRLTSIAKRQLGLNVSVKPGLGRRILAACYSRAHADFLREQFGHGSHHKHIPSWAFCLPDGKVQALIEGLIDGDGHRYGAGHGMLSTTSEHLAYQGLLLLSRFGFFCTLSKQESRGAFTLNYQSEARQKGLWMDEDFVYYPVISTTKEPFTGLVFNLEVEGDNSFLTPLAVHNCQEGWGLSVTQAQAVGRPVIGLSEGAASEQILFGEVTSSGRVDYTARLTKAVPDPVGIAAAIDRIVEKGVFFSPETARLTAEKYNWDRIAERWIAVIDRVHAERESLSLYIPEPDERLKAPAAAVREVTP